MNMVVNVTAFVPRIIIDERFEGSVMAVIIGIPLTVLLLYFFTNAMLRFPGKGLPEILFQHTSKWFNRPSLILLSILFFFSGWILLLAFTDITRTFINPEMTRFTILTIFLLVVGFGVLLKTEKVLYALEILTLISLPFILVIFFKAYTSPYLNWDSIRVVFTHVNELPTLSSLGSVTFSLYGFYNISIYNRVFKGEIKKINIWWTMAIIILGYVNAFTSGFIPIGFNGTSGVEDFIYPWISTSDSLRMEYGFVERIIYITLLLFIGASLIMVITIWHVGLKLLLSLFAPSKETRLKTRILSRSIVTLLIIVTYITGTRIDARQLLELTKLYYIILIPISIFFTIIVSWIAWGKKHET